LYALRRPEKLSAWLPVSQMVDFKRSEQVSAAEAIRRARGAGREEDAERLAQELEQVLALRRLDRAGAGTLLRFRRRKERYLPPQYGGPSPLGGLAAPELTGNDLRWKLCFDRMLAANAALYEELLGGLSLDGCPPRYGVPVILTAGERDWTTPYPLAAAYYDTLSAPCKVFLSLPDAGHLPFRERPEEWSHILLDALAQI
ncbi:alpha/beta hydrolase, partial [Flavonifractor plautii]